MLSYLRRLPTLAVVIALNAITPIVRADCPTPSAEAQVRQLFDRQGGQRPGVLEIYDELPYSPSEYSIEPLGKGFANLVFKVTPKRAGEIPFVLKMSDVDTALNDSLALLILRDLNPNSSGVTIVDANFFKYGKHSSKSKKSTALVKTRLIEGETLFSVLANDQVPAATKAMLREKYRDFANSVIERAKKADLFPKTERPELFYFESEKAKYKDANDFEHAVRRQPDGIVVNFPLESLFDAGFEGVDVAQFNRLNQLTHSRLQTLIEAEKGVSVFIKSDNFIVTKDFDLVLIDPH